MIKRAFGNKRKNGGIIALALLITLSSIPESALANGGKTLVYFSSDTCSYCDMQDEIMKDFKNDLKSLNIQLEKVNVKTDKAKVIEYGYKKQRLPYFLVVDNKEVVAEGKGLHLKDNLISLLEDKEKTEITFDINNNYFIKNNQQVNMSNKVFISDGELYAPVRALANALSIPDSNIKYEEGIVSIIKRDTLVEFMVGTKAIRIQDNFFDIPNEPKMIDGVVYIPAKYLAYALGYETKIEEGRATIISMPTKTTSIAGVDPEKHIIDDVVYYSLEEMLVLGGVSTFEYFFEKEDLIILNNDFKYKAILLNDENNSIFLINSDNDYYKYELENKPLFKDGTWLVRGDNDAIKIGMLATLIR